MHHDADRPARAARADGDHADLIPLRERRYVSPEEADEACRVFGVTRPDVTKGPWATVAVFLP